MRAVLAELVAAGLVLSLARTARAYDPETWHVGATAYGYAVPDQQDFVLVVASLDLRRFHLEGRYNYEGFRTGSVFLGLNAGLGDKLRLDVTGMLGAVVGELDGVAPALRITLSWWKLDLSTENEYVLDVHDRSDDFFYSWSELGFSPLHWLRVGAVAQRTQIIDSPLEIQRGLLAGVTVFRAIDVTFYELNLGWVTPTYILAVGASR
jgi:hypothetical protein